MGSFKTHRRQAHAMLDDDGETLLIYPATAPGHDCKVSKVIENMASGTFQISNITAPIAIEVPVHSIEDHGDDKDALRTLAQQGANLLEESFSNFAHLGVLSPPAEPLADTEPMDEYEAMACIDSFIDFGSDDDDEDVPESMDTSALATQITSPVFSNEATFAPSTDYVAETSNTQGLVDGFHNDLIGAFRSDSDIIAQNPYSSAFEDDSLTSPLFPSQSSVLSPNKRRCESIAEDEETEQRPEKRAHIGSGIEVFGSKY